MAEINSPGKLVKGESLDKFKTTSSARFNFTCERTAAKQQKRNINKEFLHPWFLAKTVKRKMCSFLTKDSRVDGGDQWRDGSLFNNNGKHGSRMFTLWL